MHLANIKSIYILYSVYSQYAMYGLHHSRNNVARGQEIVILERGSEGWLKCNIDAAFHEGVGITSFG
jgi:hypothetical protein